MLNGVLIKIENKTRENLEALKFHHRETYDDVIQRLLRNADPKSLRKEFILDIDKLAHEEYLKKLKEGASKKDNS